MTAYAFMLQQGKLAEDTLYFYGEGSNIAALFPGKPPDALKPGANAPEIRVTNLWVNILIGDAQPAADKKYSFAAQQLYRADSPFAPSGPPGPVQIIGMESVDFRLQ